MELKAVPDDQLVLANAEIAGDIGVTQDAAEVSASDMTDITI